MYDENGEPFGFSFGGNDYYYVRNAQNDVYLIVDSNNQAVVLYEYDAWGNITHCYDTSTNDIVSTLNPYTYRGYFRDSETGFYYLKSRYYYPEFHRFICADDEDVLKIEQGSIIQYNIFSYCLNNPINRIDESGYLSKLATAGIIVGAVLCLTAITILTGGVGTASLIGAVAVGAAKGALIGAGIGILAGGGIGYAKTGTFEGALDGAAIGFGAGAITGAVIGGAVGGANFGTFRTTSELTTHFEKHASEFGKMYSSPKDYAKGAKYVIKNGKYIAEKNAYIRFLGIKGGANYAFVGLKAGGRISTYHVVSAAYLAREGVSMFLS